MDQEKIKSISKEVYRRFPEMKGKKPKVQALKLSSKRGADKGKTFLLVYGSRVNIDSQQTISRIIRVVATEEGAIVKISTSK